MGSPPPGAFAASVHLQIWRATYPEAVTEIVPGRDSLLSLPVSQRCYYYFGNGAGPHSSANTATQEIQPQLEGVGRCERPLRRRRVRARRLDNRLCRLVQRLGSLVV